MRRTTFVVFFLALASVVTTWQSAPAAAAGANPALPAAGPKAAGGPRHLRRRRDLNMEPRHERYRRNQVHARRASTKWKENGGLAKRAAAASPTPTTCADPNGAYDQCYGLIWFGSTCCVSGYTCTQTSVFIWQCLPSTTTTATPTSTKTTTSTTSAKTTTTSTTSAKTTTSTTSTKTTSTSAAATPTPPGPPAPPAPPGVVAAVVTPCPKPVGAYGQCGGTRYTGSTCCTTGYKCSQQSVSYSQCVPG